MTSSSLNQLRWSERGVARAYGKAGGLYAAEVTVLSRLRAERSDWRVLDVGIGSGRTTPHLIGLGRSYVGLDYSPEMVRLARQRTPSADIRMKDARDLSDFADGSVDLVWFSFNGIDYASHEDRLRILGEIRRVLARGGAFLFSSHNRDFSGLSGITSVQPPSFAANPLRMAVRLARFLQARLNSYRLRSLEQHGSEYSVLNDSETRHRFLTYYIPVPAQVQQLARSGFDKTVAFGKDGDEIDVSIPYTDDYMVSYLAR